MAHTMSCSAGGLAGDDFSQYRHVALRSIYQFVNGIRNPTNAPQFLHHSTMTLTHLWARPDDHRLKKS
jgi:hypothetical protein